MNIAIVGPAFPYKGGGAHHTTELAHRLAAAGHDVVIESWRAQSAEAVHRAIGSLTLPEEPHVHIAEGRSWDEALEEPTWDDGELLVVGSSQSESRLSWVFLGSNGTRIIRHSPVPVVVVPGAAAR